METISPCLYSIKNPLYGEFEKDTDIHEYFTSIMFTINYIMYPRDVISKFMLHRSCNHTICIKVQNSVYNEMLNLFGSISGRDEIKLRENTIELPLELEIESYEQNIMSEEDLAIQDTIVEQETFTFDSMSAELVPLLENGQVKIPTYDDFHHPGDPGFVTRP
jgi:hypothetical protein